MPSPAGGFFAICTNRYFPIKKFFRDSVYMKFGFLRKNIGAWVPTLFLGPSIYCFFAHPRVSISAPLSETNLLTRRTWFLNRPLYLERVVVYLHQTYL